VHLSLNINELISPRPPVLWGVLTQHIALTTVEGVFCRNNCSGSLWSHICATVSVWTGVGTGTRWKKFDN